MTVPANAPAYEMTDVSWWDMIVSSGLLWTIPVALGAALFAVAMRSLRARDRAGGGPQLRAMATEIGLRRTDLRTLSALADAASLASPHGLLISEGLFRHATTLAGPRLAATAEQLQKRVFPGTDAG